MDIEDQAKWAEIIENSALSITGFCAIYEFQRKTLMKWLDGTNKPRKSNREWMIHALDNLSTIQRLPRDPSYGYASREQISRLQAIGICPERTLILEKIELQNKLQGKIA